MHSIESILKSQVDHYETPSVQYAFFDANGIACELRYGLRNIERGEEVDTATTYHLYSITKTFTALSVLQLAQAGKVELSKRASFYLPGFPYEESITIEQLLSHTAGIPNPLPLRWIHLANEHDSFNRNAFFAEIFRKHHRLQFKPGTNFKYSNLGYVLLGQLVEQVSGFSFEEYVTKQIIERCKIRPRELGFKLIPSIHAVGYHKFYSFSNALFGLLIDKGKYMGRREGRWQPFYPFYNNGTAYGGMFGSLSGLVTYGRALMQPDSVLLDNQYRKRLFTEVIAGNKPRGMSLSWFKGVLKHKPYFAHAGGGGGYYTELRVYPELKAGSVIMYNRSGMRDVRMLDRADRFFIRD